MGAPRAAISLTSTPRLMSPIELVPSALSPVSPSPASLLPPISHTRIQAPRSSCTPVPRRRTKPYPTTHQRRRPLSHSTCHPEPSVHAFDRLPWIAALNSSPDHYDIWDIADLSQIPMPRSSIPASGPVRRRKTSLRTSLTPTPPLPFPPPHPDRRPTTPPRETAVPFPTSVQGDTSSPKTPPRTRFNPSRVLFRHLMPVLRDPHNDESDHCTFTPLQLC